MSYLFAIPEGRFSGDEAHTFCKMILKSVSETSWKVCVHVSVVW